MPAQASQAIGQQALSIGQNTFDFIVSFFGDALLFFLLRDGFDLSKTETRFRWPSRTPTICSTSSTVIRATIKGNVAVAAAQGLLGGMAFAFLGVQEKALLWGVVMAFLSLLPAVGAA